MDTDRLLKRARDHADTLERDAGLGICLLMKIFITY